MHPWSIGFRVAAVAWLLAACGAEDIVLFPEFSALSDRDASVDSDGASWDDASLAADALAPTDGGESDQSIDEAATADVTADATPDGRQNDSGSSTSGSSSSTTMTSSTTTTSRTTTATTTTTSGTTTTNTTTSSSSSRTSSSSDSSSSS
jgi:hypothetical protein